MENTIYLEGTHEGWIINLLVDGVEVISPGCGELEVEQTCGNAVTIIEKANNDQAQAQPPERNQRKETK